MSPQTDLRIGGLVLSLFCVVGIPGFVFGPVLFDGVGVAAIPFTAKLVAALSALFGWWLGIVSYAARAQDLEQVLAPFEGGEIALVFLPFILWIGTKSVLRRCWHGWR